MTSRRFLRLALVFLLGSSVTDILADQPKSEISNQVIHRNYRDVQGSERPSESKLEDKALQRQIKQASKGAPLSLSSYAEARLQQISQSVTLDAGPGVGKPGRSNGNEAATAGKQSVGDFLSVGEAVTFGVWKLYANESYLTIWGEGQSRALALWDEGNGSIHAQVGGQLYALLSWGESVVRTSFAGTSRVPRRPFHWASWRMGTTYMGDGRSGPTTAPWRSGTLPFPTLCLPLRRSPGTRIVSIT